MARADQAWTDNDGEGLAMAPSKAKSRTYDFDEPRGSIRGTTRYLASRRGSREYVGVPTTRYQECWSPLLGPMASYQASWQSI